MIFLDLFIGFLKVGCFAFGGAYAAIPIIRDVVLDYGWLNDEMLTYMIAVSESTPGPIMVNLATYIGSSQGGVLGAALATFAVALPAFIVMILVVQLLKALIKNECVQAVLNGIIPCVIGVVLSVGLYMLFQNCVPMEKGMAVDVIAVIVAVILIAVLVLYKRIFKKKMSPILLIGISAVVGMIAYGI